MDIVVCVKQVPATMDVRWDSVTGSLSREGTASILNRNDAHALEEALRIREKHGGIITVLSMGPPQAEDALREALSMGIDRAVLLCDKVFAGADTFVTSYVLSLAVRKLEKYDLIICGKETSDGMTAQVGPQLAEFLDLPQLTYATRITVRNKTVQVLQKIEGGSRTLQTMLPALITVEREINEPRIPLMDSIIDAYREKEVRVWEAEDLGGSRECFGLKGSPSQVRRVYKKDLQKRKAMMLKGKPDQVARNLIDILRTKDLI